jgi:asparagine synthase (glutamine-hydrolysing)
MAFMLPFFDSVTRQHGREVGYLTGDGGDKILPDHRPKSEVLNLETLVRYVLAKHEVLPLSTAARLAGVKELDIVAALEERLRSYPEESLDDRHIHFVLFERGFKWLFEGEDRNRHFFWSTSPFYGREPFRLAMGCPARLKARYAFYRHFIESLKRELVDVESTTCGPSLRVENHPVHRLIQTLRKWSPQIVRKSWRRFSRPPVSAAVLDCMREQLAQSSSATTTQVLPMDANALLGQLERTQAYMLLTLTSTIEYFTTGHSTLERYGDTEFT